MRSFSISLIFLKVYTRLSVRVVVVESLLRELPLYFRHSFICYKNTYIFVYLTYKLSFMLLSEPYYYDSFTTE